MLTATRKTAHDLLEAGFIDARKVRSLDLLCFKPPPEFTPRNIQALRRKLDVSQTVLAYLINTSVSTVQKWEVGDKKPTGSALRLLDLLDRKGIDAVS